MFFTKAFLALAAVVSIVNAQSFDASSVDKATKGEFSNICVSVLISH